MDSKKITRQLTRRMTERLVQRTNTSVMNLNFEENAFVEAIPFHPAKIDKDLLGPVLMEEEKRERKILDDKQKAFLERKKRIAEQKDEDSEAKVPKSQSQKRKEIRKRSLTDASLPKTDTTTTPIRKTKSFAEKQDLDIASQIAKRRMSEEQRKRFASSIDQPRYSASSMTMAERRAMTFQRANLEGSNIMRSRKSFRRSLTRQMSQMYREGENPLGETNEEVVSKKRKRNLLAKVVGTAVNVDNAKQGFFKAGTSRIVRKISNIVYGEDKVSPTTFMDEKIKKEEDEKASIQQLQLMVAVKNAAETWKKNSQIFVEGESQSLMRGSAQAEALDLLAEAEMASMGLFLHDNRWYIIHPNSRFLYFWQTFINILLLWVVLYLPYQAAWNAPDYCKILDIIVNALFLLDCVLNFFCGYYDKRGAVQITVTNPHAIARHYISGWFFVDFVSSFPFEIFKAIANAEFSAEFGMFVNGVRLCKLGRLKRNMDHFSVRTEKFDLNRSPVLQAILRVTALIILFYFIVHWIGCLLFMIGEWEYNRGNQSWLDLDNGVESFSLLEKSVHTQYITSIYFALTTASTIGYGEYHPISNTEKLIWMFTTSIGLVMYAVIFGVVHTTIQDSELEYRRHIKATRDVETYCRLNDLPPELEAKLVKYQTRAFDMSKGLDMKAMSKKIPEHLKNQIHMYLYRTEIEKVPFFQGCDDAFLRAIASNIEECFCLEQDFLYQVDDPANLLFFLRTGTALVVDRNDTVLNTMLPGSVFGELGILSNAGLRTASVRAVVVCEFWTIEKDKLGDVFNRYPEYTSRLIAMALARLEPAIESMRPVVKQIRSEKLKDELTNDNPDEELSTKLEILEKRLEDLELLRDRCYSLRVFFSTEKGLNVFRDKSREAGGVLQYISSYSTSTEEMIRRTDSIRMESFDQGEQKVSNERKLSSESRASLSDDIPTTIKRLERKQDQMEKQISQLDEILENQRKLMKAIKYK